MVVASRALDRELEIAIRIDYLGKRNKLKEFAGITGRILKREGHLCMPEVGDIAPDFELPSHLEKGKKVKLSDFRGKQNVVLAFYPLAWTPV